MPHGAGLGNLGALVSGIGTLLYFSFGDFSLFRQLLSTAHLAQPRCPDQTAQYSHRPVQRSAAKALLKESSPSSHNRAHPTKIASLNMRLSS
jgi:hypothetical protein